LGEFQTNSYLLYKNNRGILIDCPDFKEIKKFLYKNNIKLEMIILTHGHYDHISGLSEKGNIPVGCSRNEEKVLRNSYYNLSKILGKEIEIKPDFIFEDEIIFNDEKIKVFPTPGHTSGSVCFYIGGILLSGDTLFYRSIGRTDFPGGDFNLLLRSIKEKILSLPYQTKVYPGHGIETTVGEERNHNPFFSHVR